MPQHRGFGHVTVSVTDLERSAEFYNRLLGGQTAMSGEDEHGPFIVCAGDGFMVGLRKHPTTPAQDSFDPFRVGLDHMGIDVESKAELDKWRAYFEEKGIQNSGIVESPYGLHLNAKDPDGIPVEFLAPLP